MSYIHRDKGALWSKYKSVFDGRIVILDGKVGVVRFGFKFGRVDEGYEQLFKIVWLDQSGESEKMYTAVELGNSFLDGFSPEFVDPEVAALQENNWNPLPQQWYKDNEERCKPVWSNIVQPIVDVKNLTTRSQDECIQIQDHSEIRKSELDLILNEITVIQKDGQDEPICGTNHKEYAIESQPSQQEDGQAEQDPNSNGLHATPNPYNVYSTGQTPALQLLYDSGSSKDCGHECNYNLNILADVALYESNKYLKGDGCGTKRNRDYDANMEGVVRAQNGLLYPAHWLYQPGDLKQGTYNNLDYESIDLEVERILDESDSEDGPRYWLKYVGFEASEEDKQTKETLSNAQEILQHWNMFGKKELRDFRRKRSCLEMNSGRDKTLLNDNIWQ
eukprot:TRINITY_DN2239_c0_g1_i12.p2 TRINITY_DN2239_c0_g1~~TRINITY_DN2239_c0_g1_i12.p2  ORF type:complete len:390 (-),score=39.57 TRINITY_DN2239_c0_g1_i12:1699-2868(-)